MVASIAARLAGCKRERDSTRPLRTHVADSFGAGIISRAQFLPTDSCAGTSWYDPPVSADLRERGYLLVKGLIEPCLARIYKTLLLKHWRGESFPDNHIPTASAVTDDAPVDALLLEVVPRISEIVGFALVPSYGYARVYFHGDAMVRHRDVRLVR